MNEKPVTLALRELREGAKVGVREMARRLGISPNSYTHYENPDRFKDPYLPMQWAIRFADALAESGVDRALVLSLAGNASSDSAASFDARLDRLSPKRREVLLSVLADLEAAEEIGRAAAKSASGSKSEGA